MSIATDVEDYKMNNKLMIITINKQKASIYESIKINKRKQRTFMKKYMT